MLLKWRLLLLWLEVLLCCEISGILVVRMLVLVVGVLRVVKWEMWLWWLELVEVVVLMV